MRIVRSVGRDRRIEYPQPLLVKTKDRVSHKYEWLDEHLMRVTVFKNGRKAMEFIHDVRDEA